MLQILPSLMGGACLSQITVAEIIFSLSKLVVKLSVPLFNYFSL